MPVTSVVKLDEIHNDLNKLFMDNVHKNSEELNSEDDLSSEESLYSEDEDEIELDDQFGIITKQGSIELVLNNRRNDLRLNEYHTQDEGPSN